MIGYVHITVYLPGDHFQRLSKLTSVQSLTHLINICGCCVLGTIVSAEHTVVSKVDKLTDTLKFIFCRWDSDS